MSEQLFAYKLRGKKPVFHGTRATIDKIKKRAGGANVQEIGPVNLPKAPVAKAPDKVAPPPAPTKAKAKTK